MGYSQFLPKSHMQVSPQLLHAKLGRSKNGAYRSRNSVVWWV